MGSTGKEASCSGRIVDGEKTTKRKPKFMCLHGFRTSGKIMMTQLLKSWPVEVISRLDLFFINGPFPCPGKSEAEGIFLPSYFEWFQHHKDFSVYEMKLEKSMARIEQLIIKYGPFDGLIGFSQGAILSAAFVGLESKGLAFKNVPKLRYLVIIGSDMFQSPQVAERVYPSKYDCISLHFLGYYGTVDWQVGVLQKIKIMKELYFDALIEMHQILVITRMQQCDSRGTLGETIHEGYEEVLKLGMYIVKQFLILLQLPMVDIPPGLDDLLPGYEEAIVSLLDLNKMSYAKLPDAQFLAMQQQSQVLRLQQHNREDFPKKSEELLELFVDPFVIHHPYCQDFPLLDDEKSLRIMHDFLGKIENDLNPDGK